VIKSSAINNDGALKVGYTAPSVDGQAEVIAEALALAGVESETISYIETHGTGTALGDPIEIAALKKVFWCQYPKEKLLCNRLGQNECRTSGCSSWGNRTDQDCPSPQTSVTPSQFAFRGA
jgi:hypothetical protein